MGTVPHLFQKQQGGQCVSSRMNIGEGQGEVVDEAREKSGVRVMGRARSWETWLASGGTMIDL